jgi:hypothetical protein
MILRSLFKNKHIVSEMRQVDKNMVTFAKSEYCNKLILYMVILILLIVIIILIALKLLRVAM